MVNLLQDSLRCTVVDFGQEDTIKSFGFLPFLQKNRIHIWSAGYEDLHWHLKILSRVISPEERHTASTFRNSADTRKYILRHGVLRIILGKYTQQDPELVSLLNGKNGKPELDPRGGIDDVFFSTSHTSDKILIGVTRKHRIGVDIVKMEPSYKFHDSAEYILTPAEKGFLQSSEPDLRYQVFFRIWAIKEAILKTTGGTLALMKNIDLTEIILDICSSQDCSMKCLDTHPPFFIWQFNSGPGHYGAIAADLGNFPEKSGIQRLFR
jgi:4'-phosphopantetheinyl transferase